MKPGSRSRNKKNRRRIRKYYVGRGLYWYDWNERRVCCVMPQADHPRKYDLLYSHMSSNRIGEFEFTGESTRTSDGLILYEVEDNRYVDPATALP